MAQQLLTRPALGAALHGAVVAGREAGGYATIFEPAGKMGQLQKKTFRPKAKNRDVSDGLFEEYQTLHGYFGRGANDVMKRLKALQSGRGKESWAQSVT